MLLPRQSRLSVRGKPPSLFFTWLLGAILVVGVGGDFNLCLHNAACFKTSKVGVVQEGSPEGSPAR